jgi:hypothetical protein
MKKELWDGKDFYGHVGETTPFLVDKEYLQVGDVVEKFHKSKSYGESYVVKGNGEYFIMGIMCDCNNKNGEISGWHIKIIKKYYEVKNLERHDGIIMIYCTNSKKAEISEFTNEELINELQKRLSTF